MNINKSICTIPNFILVAVPTISLLIGIISLNIESLPDILIPNAIWAILFFVIASFGYYTFYSYLKNNK